MIHMKYQALFSQKNSIKKIYFWLLFAANSLRVNL